MAILVCGGAGYIGSHTCVELIKNGYDVVVADNLSNSSMEAVRRIEQITGSSIVFEEIDMCDKGALDALFIKYEIEAAIHFAGFKAVKESVEKPVMYYTNNLISTLNLLECMKKYGVNKLIFSSSATVYGDAETMPINEAMVVGGTTNPYGTSKYVIECILKDCCKANPELNVAVLRYFNPIGAHESGLIGEDPNGVPNNLVPYIAQVAVGKLEQVHVYGNDYPTPDGTGVRDYIHVVDLARGHVAALEKVNKECGLFICNLGTGRGYSVLEVIRSYEKACGKAIPYVIDSRRPGDIATCYADTQKAYEEMGWKAELTIEDMCASSWKWQNLNPNGYK